MGLSSFGPAALSPPPATASAEGRLIKGGPFPATVWAEGRQFNGAPSLWERELCVFLLITAEVP